MSTADPFRLEGRRVLITGGTQGVGGSIARGIARAGGDVFLIGLKIDAAAEQTLSDCRSFGVQAEAIAVDLAESPSVWAERLLTDVLERMPGIDTLVNNAGIYIDQPFLDMDEGRFDRTMNLNVKAGFFLTQALSRRWVAGGVGGRVLFTGSINGFLSEPDHVVYDGSKGAVAAMVRSLCVSLAPMGIRVNSMAPGLVHTPLTGAAIDQGHFRQWMRLHTPNGQVPDASVCAGAAVFLLSDAAEHVHGQTLMVDGGMSVWQQPDPPAGYHPDDANDSK